MNKRLLILAALVVNVAQVNSELTAASVIVEKVAGYAAPVLEALAEKGVSSGTTEKVTEVVKSPSFLSKVFSLPKRAGKGAWDLTHRGADKVWGAVTWAPKEVCRTKLCRSELTRNNVATKVFAFAVCAAVVVGVAYAVKTFCLEEGTTEDADSRGMEFCDEECEDGMCY